MALQGATHSKSFPAGLAQERFLSCVDAFMVLQGALQYKSPPEGAAQEQSLSWVNASGSASGSASSSNTKKRIPCAPNGA